MPYPQRRSSGILVFFSLLVIIGAVFFLFGSRITVLKGLHERIFGKDFLASVSTPKKEYRTDLILPPEKEMDWCRVQEIKVGDSNEDPTRHRNLGWDSQNKACVTEYTGYSNCLKKTVEVTYAYTGIVGGRIVWVMTDGIYGDVDRYRDYVGDLGKFEISNKPCDETLYGDVMI